MKPAKLAAIIAVSAAIACAWVAQGADSAPTSRVPTVTRLVKLFTDREAALAAAVRAGDETRAQSFLTDDFEMRTGAAPANPIPRADWLSEMIRTRNPGEAATGMAVHDLNGTAIVSFSQGRGPNSIFVVDVWRTAGNDWRLAVRYAAPAGSALFQIPGAGAPSGDLPKKY